jgi:hypothetical protein
LDILGFDLRKKNIIDTVGAENIPKMEEELARQARETLRNAEKKD